MSMSIDFNAVTPEQVKEYIDYVMKIATFLKVLNLPKLNIVVDFMEQVASKEVTTKAIALIFELIHTNWQFKQLVADLKN